MESFDKENLYNTVKKISSDSAIGIDHQSYTYFKKNITTIVNDISTKVSKNTYSFTNYRELLFLKDRFSFPRCISIPTLKDKLCLYGILNELRHSFQSQPNIVKPIMPQQAVAQLKRNIQRKNYTAFIKLDINHFFDTIKHFRLYKILEEFDIERPLIDLIKLAITTPTGSEKKKQTVGIPQGLPISNILSEIYMFDFLSEVKVLKNTYVIRYVDDIIILCPIKHLNTIENKVKCLIDEKYILSINPRKIKKGKLLNNGFDFLGYHFYSKKGQKKILVTVRSSSIQKLQNRLIHVLSHYKKISKNSHYLNVQGLFFDLNLIISGSIHEIKDPNNKYVKRYGWLFFYSQINDYSVLYSLDALVKKKIHHMFPNMNPDEYKYLHSFVSSFRDIHYNSMDSKNIFYLDRYSVDEEKHFLYDKFRINTDKYSNEKIDSLFKRTILKKIKRHEQELVNNFS